MPASLLGSAFVAAAEAAVFIYVGQRLARREVSPDAEPALQLFATWWFGLAGSNIATGTSELFAWTGIERVGLHAGLTYVNLLFIVLSVFALLYYLVYVFRGKLAFFIPATAVYLGYFLVLLYLLTMANPVSIEVHPWQVTLEQANPLSGWETNAIVVLLLVPPIVALASYLRLYWHVDTRTQRYRIPVIGLSIGLWLAGTLLVHLAGASEATLWPLASKLAGLVAAVAVLMAYFPPSWIRSRGVKPLGADKEESPGRTSAQPGA